jgi:hypothetical protein
VGAGPVGLAPKQVLKMDSDRARAQQRWAAAWTRFYLSADQSKVTTTYTYLRRVLDVFLML